MTDQELYDRVKEHLLTQMSHSKEGILCVYRDNEGRKCAIGCLIPDEKYTAELEGKPVHTTGVMAAADLASNQMHLAIRLQRVHDGFATNQWAIALESVARKFGLEP